MPPSATWPTKHHIFVFSSPFIFYAIRILEAFTCIIVLCSLRFFSAKVGFRGF